MKRFGLNSLWLVLARLGTQAVGLALAVLLARRLGEAGFGQYAWLAAVVALGNTVTTFGTDTLIIRELARDERAMPALLGAALWLQLALSAIWLVFVWLWPPGTMASPALVGLFSLSLIPLALSTVFSAALRARERMELYLALNLAVALAQLAGVAVWVQSLADLPTLALVLAAANAGGAVLAAELCVRAVPRFAVDWRVTGGIVGAILWAALPLALLTGFAIAYQRLGVFALSALAGEAATGWYSAAARLVEGLKLGHFAVFGALLPALSQAPAQTAQTARRAWIVLLAASTALALIISLLAAPLVRLFYGDRYLPSIPALQILIWSLLPYSLSAYLSVRLVARNAEYILLAGTLLTFLVAVALQVWLIPLWGVTGACVGLVISECVLAVLLAAFSRRADRFARVNGASSL
jgi:O-antigen/teichoic acid export membrane protein